MTWSCIVRDSLRLTSDISNWEARQMTDGADGVTDARYMYWGWAEKTEVAKGREDWA